MKIIRKIYSDNIQELYIEIYIIKLKIKILNILLKKKLYEIKEEIVKILKKILIMRKIKNF